MCFRLLTLLFLASALPLFADDKAPDISKMPYEVLEKNGTDYFLKNKLDESWECFQEMLRRQKAKKEPVETEIGVAYYGLGRIAILRKNFSEAIKYFEEAQKRLNEGNTNPVVISGLLYYLATAYYREKQFEKALELENEEIPLTAKIYGKDSSKFAISLLAHASTLYALNRQKEAIPLARNAYDIMCRCKGKDDTTAQNILKKLSEWENETVSDKK